jgi:hypothetical protein
VHLLPTSQLLGWRLTARAAPLLQVLEGKAEERNPDEFYFAMENAQTKDGVHIQRCVRTFNGWREWARVGRPRGTSGTLNTHAAATAHTTPRDATQVDAGQQVQPGGAAADEDAGRKVPQPQEQA